ncbi:hypothetical protein E2A64_10085 [Pseudohoeflea suaedae]|uniref:Uncharacterized protein n=1 Tax=Pseudohoeflea suaedae TaxID=877384 RepID=A0A4R5PJ57_9HYPH|nr:hypothetical protein [Pseudohoeflea suaedae]TDH35680.1 hypothetical protein E2A64_10085 [Pseudohoeflea suaedae]
MNMVERVARAIANEAHKGGDYGMTGDDAYDRRPEEFTALARAAIEAMREPTKGMEDAPSDAEIDFGPGGSGDLDASPLNVWQAMIDAALGEKPRT